MPGATTALGWAGARTSASVHIAFRFQNSVSAQNKADFAAQWLAYAIPCRRFADALADTCARLGADVVCYAFIAVDLHHILLADLSAHSGVGLSRSMRYATNPSWGVLRDPLLLCARLATNAPITRVGEEQCYQHANPVQSPSKKLDA